MRIAFVQYCVRDAFAKVLYRGKSEADCVDRRAIYARATIKHDREVRTAFVYVWRKHGNAEAFALGYERRDRFRITGIGRKHGSHVLNRIISL